MEAFGSNQPYCKKWGFEWQTAPPAGIKLCCLYIPASNALHQWALRLMAAQRKFSPTDGRVALPKFEGDTPMTPGGSLREWPGRSAGSGWGPAPQGHRGSGVSRSSLVHMQQQRKYPPVRKIQEFDKLAFWNEKVRHSRLLHWHCLDMKTREWKTFCIPHLCHILFMRYKREHQAFVMFCIFLSSWR